MVFEVSLSEVHAKVTLDELGSNIDFQVEVQIITGEWKK